ncbi:ribokinase [Lysobacter arseniciresistens ZS79]|uniref:Ribokinase n=1 Tax=Lysobacter arseniciresistens ZS79 TaxID=913325 RepID=A0A0A0F2R5_9GAMM|nr:ribokinase [Lysobacter arseniciresistens]KGM57411.1 ribokinase [Lysobacter arseniciresistens ZS79]
MAGLVVIGSFNVDHVWSLPRLPRPGETLAGHYHTGPGGKGFNQATAGARAGASTVFICSLGADAGGQLARALAAADGIDLRDAASDEPTGTAGIHVDAEGRNSIVIGPGANAGLSVAHVHAHSDAIAHAAVVLAQLETPADAVLAGFDLAREAGATTVLNPAPADADVPPELLALTDVLTPNESEFCAQLARQCGETLDPDAVAALDGATLHALCRRLLPGGTVVVTLGGQGCFVSHPADARRGDAEAAFRVPAAPARVVDTTGAGDAFSGALAAAMATDPDAAFGRHVRFAGRYAALACERAGAASAMPRRDEFDR